MTCNILTLNTKEKKKNQPQNAKHGELQTDTQKVTQCYNFKSVQIPCEIFSENYLEKRQVLK